MALAVSMWFDAALELELLRLWQELADAGVSSRQYDGRYRPHVTLGIWDTDRLDAVEMECHALVEDRTPFRIDFPSVGLFPGDKGVVFLHPFVSDGLMALHRDTHERMRALGPPAVPYYDKDRWVPHCTMAIDVPREQGFVVADRLLDFRPPLGGDVVALGIIDTPAEIERARISIPR